MFKATYFFDASTIVKLVVPEPGSEKVKRLLDECGIAHTSWVLIAEALGCLKRKRRDEVLTDEGYSRAVYALFAYIKGHDLDPMDLGIEGGRAILLTHENEMFGYHLRYRHLDVADTLQLTIIKESYLAAFAGESQAHLVTADSELGKAAEAEGIPVIYVNVDQ
jgi:predicted nucleic acid-binding protein